jgi:flavin-dependent dehydrogenase
MPDTLAALRELGVNLNMADGHPCRGIRFLAGNAKVDAKFPSGAGLGVRRSVLQWKMARRAEECGVSLLWNSPVTGIRSDGVAVGGRVIRARWIVGADGISSRVRRWVGLDINPQKNHRYALRRHYRVAPWSDGMEIYWGRQTQAYLTPVGEQEVCVVLISRRREADFNSLDAEFPQLRERFARAEETSRQRGAVTTMRQLDRVHCGRVALTGDASGSVDAITGEGLRLGFHQAHVLADALAAGDLNRYQRAHRRLARRPTLMGRLMLLMDGNEKLCTRAMRALASDPAIFARLLAVHVGETSATHLAATGALLGWRLATA